MTKRLLSLLMCFILIFCLTSCKSDIKIDNEEEEEVTSTYIVDTSNLEAIDRKYVDFVYTGGTALYKSWNSPNEIDPYNLFISFCYDDTRKIKSSEKIIDLKTNAAYYTIDTVYGSLSKHFDFDKEILKNSECYDNKLGMLYHQGLGSIMFIHYTITSAKQTDDILEIHYNIDDNEDISEDFPDTVHLSCILKIKIIDEDNFKYISYHVEDNKDYIK